MLKNIIRGSLVTADRKTSLRDAARLMADKDVGAVLVVEGRRPVGIITDRDLAVRCISEGDNPAECHVEDHMSKTVHVAKESDGVFDCIRQMHDHGVRRVPVVNQAGEAIGMVSFGDLISVLSKELAVLSETTTPSEERRPKVA